MKCSLIIPCYNESESLPELVERCQAITLCGDTEVILVDNGSTDNTPHILREILLGRPNIRSIRVEVNQGYGHGIIMGLRSGKGRILGWTHADLQTNPQDILEGIKLFDKYGDNIFIKGRRYGRPFSDVVFTFGMTFVEALLLRKWMLDINAQPTMFSNQFFIDWKSPPDDFSLDLFAFYQAKVHKIKIYRFPVFFGIREYGISRWNFSASAKWKFIRRTISYSLILRKKVLG
jgi:glycosyltransferase involved in cell wall biosynthesis